MAACRFTVLGPPGVVCDGIRLNLGTPQQRAVLMVLQAKSGRFVRIGELIDGIWGGRPPASCESIVRTYVSRLRRSLSEHGLDSAIRSDDGAYMFDSSPFALDVSEFAELVETARQQRAAGDNRAAAARLEEALGLWTGTALAGVPGDAAQRERTRLERARLTATQELLQLRLELGEHAQVVADIPLLLHAHPLDELLYEIYLVALYRSGRRAEALAVYRTFYELLSSELGTVPRAGLRAIQEGILRADTDLGGEFVPAAPSRGSERRAARPGTTHPAFVGREAERAAFEAMLVEGDGVALLFVCGPPGIGKSILLRTFADDAVAAARAVWNVCDLPTAQLRQRLEQLRERSVAGPTNASQEGQRENGPVVLIDSFEAHGALEAWLRTEYLRKLPGGAVVVIAGRKGPSAAWLTDPAWSQSIALRRLDVLTAAQAVALAEAHGAGADLVPSIVEFSGGNPFALSLAAEVARNTAATGRSARRAAIHYVVDNVVAAMTGNLPTAMHRRALHVCAHSRYTTEDLLRTVVPGGRPDTLFDWLRKQPYVEAAARGLEINGLLQKALDHHLRWRDPVGYEQMHRRIRHYVTNRLLRDCRDPQAATAVIQTIGHSYGLGHYVSEVEEEDLRSCVATPADHDELVALARATQGESTAASVLFWLCRQPKAFSLLRSRRTNRLRGFLSWLVLSRPNQEELDTDPIVRAVWDDLSGRPELPSDAHIAVARHLVGPVREPVPSPVTDVFQAWLMRAWLHEPKLAASYVVTPDGRFWQSLMEHLGHYELKCPHTENPHVIFGHDWLATPSSEWRDHRLGEELWTDPWPTLFLREDASGRNHQPS